MLSGRMPVHGALVEGAAQLAVINPATGLAFATVARADAAQHEAAIAAAKAAAPDGTAG